MKAIHLALGNAGHPLPVAFLSDLWVASRAEWLVLVDGRSLEEGWGPWLQECFEARPGLPRSQADAAFMARVLSTRAACELGLMPARARLLPETRFRDWVLARCAEGAKLSDMLGPAAWHC